MKNAFTRALRSFKDGDSQKSTDIGSVLADVLAFDEGKTQVSEVRLFLRDHSLKLKFNHETDSWISTITNDCNARIVVTLVTECVFSGSSSSGRYFAFSRKPRTDALKVLKKRTSSGLDAADLDVTIDGSQGPVGICLWYDSLTESTNWYPMSAVGGNVQSLQQEGYESAEAVSGHFPLSFVLDYLRLARYKVFSETPLDSSSELTRYPGLYSSRHFCVHLMEYINYVSSSWKERVDPDSLGYKVEMNHRVTLLSSERKAIMKKGEELNEPNIRIRREY